MSIILLTVILRTVYRVKVYVSKRESIIGSTLNLAKTQITEITVMVIIERISTLIANQRGTASDHILALMLLSRYLKF